MKANKKDVLRIEYRGFGFGSVALAFLAGAAAGAVAAYLNGSRTGDENRERLRALADDTRNAAARLPEALRKASLAARDALSQTLAEVAEAAAAEDESQRAA